MLLAYLSEKHRQEEPFFVMLVAFSNQDQQKLQIVAGSMRDAFGVQNNVRYSGIIEVDGLPTRPKLTNAAHIQPDDASATPTPDAHDRKREYGAKLEQDQAFALASLRQAMQDMPELTEASKHIMVKETREGLHIEIVDQDGRSLFPEGSKDPYERTRVIIQKLAARSRRPHIDCPSPAARRRPGTRRAPVTVHGISRRIAPIRCAPFSRKGDCSRRTSSRSPAKPIPTRCSPTIPTWPPIGG
jgi:hypothetical protein